MQAHFLMHILHTTQNGGISSDFKHLSLLKQSNQLWRNAYRLTAIRTNKALKNIVQNNALNLLVLATFRSCKALCRALQLNKKIEIQNFYPDKIILKGIA